MAVWIESLVEATYLSLESESQQKTLQNALIKIKKKLMEVASCTERQSLGKLVRACVHVWAYAHACMHVRAHASMHACTRACSCECACVFVCAYMSRSAALGMQEGLGTAPSREHNKRKKQIID